MRGVVEPLRSRGTGPRTFVGLVLLQRIHVALNVDYHPVKGVGAAYRDAGTQVVDNWECNTSGGWRFLF